MMMRYDPFHNNSEDALPWTGGSLQAKQHELLGTLVQEILCSGKLLNRKTLFVALIASLDQCDDVILKTHYEAIFSLLLGRLAAE
ncbi:hypothetical protein KOL70_16320 [Pantoea sp. B270]|uniref:biofilm development regulator YmgB/AriR family protein n=1 Tax=Pantoea sp. B270 TaxID=2836826 RepID=UPI001BFF443F|nr:biofilm development regulator YmgB/AriR family protein [Pantoea sp. B270]MBU6519535.1 hypothetical protein [Pantoea sp. B270]